MPKPKIKEVDPYKLKEEQKQDNKDEAEFLGKYQEVSMGHIDWEERPFMIVDKDTGQIIDTRDDNAIQKLETPNGMPRAKSNNIQQNDKADSAWADWWREKKKSNIELITASESGDLKKVRKFLDKG